MFIKKTTVVWLLNNVKDAVSSDRLHRFVRNNDRRIDSINIQSTGVHGEIHVGDWCIFECDDQEMYGNVVGFEYIEGRGKSRSYTLDYAPVVPPKECSKRGINVIANWFLHDDGGDLQLTDQVHNSMIDIKNYKQHLLPPFMNKPSIKD